MRTAKILMTVLLLGAPTWVGGQAARPTTGAPEVFNATAQAKNATGAMSGTLEVRVSRYTPEFDRTTVETALRQGGYPRFITALRNAPEVGRLVLGGGPSYVIRYAREKVESGGRTIVMVTDKPVFFLERRANRVQAASRIRSGRAPDSAGWKWTGARNDGGCRARASRWRRWRAAGRLRRDAHRADHRYPQARSAAGRRRARGTSSFTRMTADVRRHCRRGTLRWFAVGDAARQTRGQVLLVDRATFPSDIPHGHFVHRHGPRRLRDWGLLSRIASRTPAITNMLVRCRGLPARGSQPGRGRVAWGYGPRRTTLDAILVSAAVESGVEFREGFHVDEYVFEDDALRGIRGRGPNGSMVEERATVTVGADGRNSRLARVVHAPVYNEAPALLCYYFSYERCAGRGLRLYVRTEQRRVVFSFKTENELFAVFIGLPLEQLPVVRRDIDAAFMQSLDAIPELGSRVRAGRREERFYGASDLPNFYRRPYGPGWALAGDAGLHKDPFLALGICDALRDVEVLAGAIGDGLASKRPMQEALADYETRRNANSAADYQENLAEAGFRPLSPRALAIRAAVRDKPGDATRLIKARMGMTDPAEFFNPENLQRLLGGPASLSSEPASPPATTASSGRPTVQR